LSGYSLLCPPEGSWGLHWSILWAKSIQLITRTDSHSILTAHLRLGLPSGLFPFDFPTNILHWLLLCHFVPHSLLISSSFTIILCIRGEKYKLWICFCEVSSSVLSLHLPPVKVLSPPCSQTSSICVRALILENKFQTRTAPQSKLYSRIF
jgi:hypothetical protein